MLNYEAAATFSKLTRYKVFGKNIFPLDWNNGNQQIWEGLLRELKKGKEGKMHGMVCL